MIAQDGATATVNVADKDGNPVPDTKVVLMLAGSPIRRRACPIADSPASARPIKLANIRRPPSPPVSISSRLTFVQPMLLKRASMICGGRGIISQKWYCLRTAVCR